MNWTFLRINLFVMTTLAAFILGRLSVEFSGTGSDWAVAVSAVIILVSSLIGLAAGELVRSRAQQE